MKKDLVIQFQEAFDLGKAACIRGKLPMPNMDKALMDIIGDRIDDNTEHGKLFLSSIMDQWQNGWVIQSQDKRVTAVFSKHGIDQFIISVPTKAALTNDKIIECVKKHYESFRSVSRVTIDTTNSISRIKVEYYNVPEVTVLDWTFLPNY